MLEIGSADLAVLLKTTCTRVVILDLWRGDPLADDISLVIADVR